MGSGIAQVFAQHGFDTILFDVSENALATAKDSITAHLGSLEMKKKIGPASVIMEKIQFTSLINDCVAGIIIEAIIERADAKITLLRQLAAINAASTIFATNTSSLSVTEIARQFSRPKQLAGMHFFNPAPVMELVEVVATKFSSPATIGKVAGLAKSIGKTPVICKDAPGFIVNHVARPYYLEALYLAEHYDAPFETTDTLMEATGFKLGPFRLMDLIGNDVNYAVSRTVYDALGKPERLRPSPIQKEKVDSGRLGRKTGRGYYEYNR